MSHDDFRSWGESVRPSAIDSVRRRENASERARRMPASDSQTPRLPGANPRSPLPMGEIVEVEGGHIVRSTGRKDRHSKVYTAKGPRDRRVRLSASTAIQFYDLQDRLGYDRPSKAVAWLIEKAKASIDELARLPEIPPPFIHPADVKPTKTVQDHEEETEAQSSAPAAAPTATIRDEHSRTLARERARERAKERTQERDKAAVDNQFSCLRGNFNLFSTATNINATHSLIQALPAPPPKPFTASQTSHAFHPMDPSVSRNLEQVSQLHQQQQQTFYHSLPLPEFSSQFESTAVAFAENSTTNHQTQQGLFSGSAYQVPAVAFARDPAMSDHGNEFGTDQSPQRILRAYPWTNSNSFSTNGGDFGSFESNAGLNIGGSNWPHHENSFTIRGTLQSSSSPVRVRPMPLAHDLAADHLFTTAAAAGGGGYLGFRIPARIQGIDEHDDVKPSASSSTSQM